MLIIHKWHFSVTSYLYTDISNLFLTFLLQWLHDMPALKGTLQGICFQHGHITWGQRCASLQSHAQAVQSGAIQILAGLAFVCFPVSMVAVLGNCKQYQHSPEIIRLPQAHALLKALFSSRRNRVHSLFIFSSFLNQLHGLNCFWSALKWITKPRLCVTTESTPHLSRRNLFG